MSTPDLYDLQESVKDRSAFNRVEDYYAIGHAFLMLIQEMQPTKIIAPNDHRYIFYQYGELYDHKITRPLNRELFFKSKNVFKLSFERFIQFLGDLKKHQDSIISRPGIPEYLSTNDVHRVIYTIQQCIGCIGDSFDNPNQSRKRIGQLFENLIRLIMQEMGFHCESRTVKIPIPAHPDFTMSYELDLVFSNNKALITSESQFIHPDEVIGSIKTTSKDRIDKIFLDKHLLSKFLGHEVKMVAIFLHDVQRARRAKSIFGINSTFKTNHFLGYTMALQRMNGVYYVDPRPEMITNPRLRNEISNFQQFITQDVWDM